ncbi:MAG TPA: hypothetical protein VGN44_10715 [Candidatus Angelobacter sp.]|jgi:hypothetical protein
MSAPTDGSSLTQTEQVKSKTPMVIAVCCACVSLALVFGVGFASHTILRHVIQTLPCWAVIALGFRGSRVTAWAALPVFLFWLVICGLIWSYLLGISHIVSGHFSPVETAMTIIVGVCAMIGIASFARFKSGLPAESAGILFLLMAIFQWVCFRVSILPAISGR